jgi:hypothetical protein
MVYYTVCSAMIKPAAVLLIRFSSGTHPLLSYHLLRSLSSPNRTRLNTCLSFLLYIPFVSNTLRAVRSLLLSKLYSFKHNGILLPYGCL